jgi:hypothetical protein
MVADAIFDPVTVAEAISALTTDEKVQVPDATCGIPVELLELTPVPPSLLGKAPNESPEVVLVA